MLCASSVISLNLAGRPPALPLTPFIHVPFGVRFACSSPSAIVKSTCSLTCSAMVSLPGSYSQIGKKGSFTMGGFDEYVRLAEDAYDKDRRSQASYDRSQREALERGSPSAPRRDLVSILNAGERQRMVSQDLSLDAVAKIRGGQRYGIHSAPSGFNFQPSDPGQVRDSRFEWAEGAPELRAGRVRDAEGRLRSSDARARDHWSSGRVKPIDPEFLLEIARKIIEAVRQRSYSQKPV